MNPANVRRAALQVGAVAGVQIGLFQHLRQLRPVMALKGHADHRRFRAFGHVLGHRVDEEQAQCLDTAFVQRFLALEVV